MNKKSIIYIIALLCILSAVFIGCAKNEENANKSEKTSQPTHKVDQGGNDGSDNQNIGKPTPTPNNDVIIDAFTGLTFEVTGISPYCKILVNNSKCSDDAQRYVTYTLDKEMYENGDIAIITACLSDVEKTNKNYVLKEAEMDFKVENQAQYITSLENVDITFLKSELNDYIASRKSSALGTNKLFDIYNPNKYFPSDIISIGETKEEATYLAAVKKMRQNSGLNFYNAINFVISIPATEDDYNNTTFNVYVVIRAYNVIQYPDGTIKWGLENPDEFGFNYYSTGESLDYAISSFVFSLSENYNLTKVQ